MSAITHTHSYSPVVYECRHSHTHTLTHSQPLTHSLIHLLTSGLWVPSLTHSLTLTHSHLLTSGLWVPSSGDVWHPQLQQRLIPAVQCGAVFLLPMGPCFPTLLARHSYLPCYNCYWQWKYSPGSEVARLSSLYVCYWSWGNIRPQHVMWSHLSTSPLSTWSWYLCDADPWSMYRVSHSVLSFSP